MYLQSLELVEFRVFHARQLRLEPAGLRLVGANGSGKSTILESVAMMATTRSPRSSLERELINFESGAELGVPPYARVLARVFLDDGGVDLALTMQLDPLRPNHVKKQFSVDGRVVRASDAVGRLKAVLFSPEDVGLIAGTPAARRRYLDVTLSQLHRDYLRALSRFNQILAHRNSLLRSFARERLPLPGGSSAAQLAFWDEELTAFGSVLISYRYMAIRRLSELANERFARLTSGHTLKIEYAPNLAVNSLEGRKTDLDHDETTAIVAREFASSLFDRRREELGRGMSLVGPQRDDFTFSLDDVDLSLYGSRGQQRLAVLALKLAEAALMSEAANEPPVVLLDDVLSELDERHRESLIDTIAAERNQLIITSADEKLLDVASLSALPILRLDAQSLTGGSS
ncbi:MAG: DNA replication and repair protein RecF [Chloroflexota bacterium]|nr:DNA replication and repair protein RecF [Chloroflexota bacterium]